MTRARLAAWWCLGTVVASACGHGASPQPGAAAAAPAPTASQVLAVGAPAASAAPDPAPEVPEPPAPPPPEQGVSGLAQGVPPLEAVASAEVERLWRGLRKTTDFREQAQRLDALRPERLRCDGLVDFRALTEGRTPGLRYRDDVRGRTHIHPALAHALVKALLALRTEIPDAVVTVGDIAQPGCGQLAHGALVREVSGPAAVALVNRARLMFGVPTVREHRDAAAFAAEVDRFTSPVGGALVETQILGQSPGLAPGEDGWTARTVTRRFQRLADADEQSTKDLREVSAKLLKGQLIREREVRHWDAEAGDVVLWLQHWVSPDERRQMVTLATRPQKKRLKLGELVEVRLARWQAEKPGSFPNELRWVAVGEPGASEPTFQRWEMLYEAGHQTHLAGRDADLSYVTTGHVDHFAIHVDGIDAKATWRWFELLDEATREVGAPLERILVDPAVKRALKAKLPKSVQKTALWNTRLRLASGHDAHHHIRVEAAEAREPEDVTRHLDALDALLGPRERAADAGPPTSAITAP